MSHTKLSDRELKVLLAILRCGVEVYAPKIRDKLREFENEALSIGALHSALDRLEQRGLVESWMGEATKVRGGKRKKLIKVTGEGQIAVSHAMHTLNAMAEGVLGGDGAGVLA
ncbi:MAG: helix-turn-helix transcriptional regulator [Rhodobacteraceae bacterium]|nr:helix-turn-helix transcriptional regulator [Paracoccaceae bacterium]